MPDPSPLTSFDVADVVSLGGALGGIVDFCRQLSAEGSLSKKTFVVKYDKTILALSSSIVYLSTSVIIGVGGAFSVQFLLIMLKSFRAESVQVVSRAGSSAGSYPQALK